jgi:ParB-like chromosome segregation protein Spo0J
MASNTSPRTPGSKSASATTLPPRSLESLPIASLTPWTRNARTHSRKQLRQIADSILRFGFTNPVLIDSENRILAGHGRVEAARNLGMEAVPCLRFDHLSQAERRAYVLADNKLALNAGWDEELLALELKELMEAEIDFSLDITGFSIAEVENLLEGLSPEEQGDPADDRLPEPDRTPRRCSLGDIWKLGSHRLLCGDALDANSVGC